MAEPFVTVLMPLYNGACYVQAAVESILRQTWHNFELLIIDDGSNDAGPEIIHSIRDDRIVFLRNSENMGVAATLNRGLAVARGRYIARMDADDMSVPDRLQRQVDFMEAHPEVGISGGWVRFFGFGASTTLRPPCDMKLLRCYALFENPFCHMTVIMRKSMMQKHNLLYNGHYSRSEDYELWSRAIHCFSLANIGRVLVSARQHPASATLSNWQEMTVQTEKIQASLLGLLGIVPRQDEQSLHHLIGRGYRQEELASIRAGERWLQYLCRKNQETGFADASTFSAVAGQIWFRYCLNSAPLGKVVWDCWRNSSLSRDYQTLLVDRMRFMASILWHRYRPSRIPQRLSTGERQRKKKTTLK